MTDDLQPAASERRPAHDTGALLIAAGGLAAAFGAASCCALPVLLGSFGLGSAWLAGVIWLAAPHRIALRSPLSCVWHGRALRFCGIAVPPRARQALFASVRFPPRYC